MATAAIWVYNLQCFSQFFNQSDLSGHNFQLLFGKCAHAPPPNQTQESSLNLTGYLKFSNKNNPDGPIPVAYQRCHVLRGLKIKMISAQHLSNNGKN